MKMRAKRRNTTYNKFFLEDKENVGGQKGENEVERLRMQLESQRQRCMDLEERVKEQAEQLER